MQNQAELVGFGIAAGGAVGSELALVRLDEVLGVSPRAIEGLVKMLRPRQELVESRRLLKTLWEDSLGGVFGPMLRE